MLKTWIIENIDYLTYEYDFYMLSLKGIACEHKAITFQEFCIEEFKAKD